VFIIRVERFHDKIQMQIPFFLFKGIILFKDAAKEALEKAKEAHNGNLQLRNKDVTWELLEGDAEKEALKKILEDQQELLKQKGKGPL